MDAQKNPLRSKRRGEILFSAFRNPSDAHQFFLEVGADLPVLGESQIFLVLLPVRATIAHRLDEDIFRVCSREMNSMMFTS